MKAPIASMPLLTVATALVAGIIAGNLSTGHDWLIFIPLTLSAAAIAARMRTVSVVLAGMALGWIAIAVNRTPQINYAPLDGQTCTGVVRHTGGTNPNFVHTDVEMTAISGYRVRPVTIRLTYSTSALADDNTIISPLPGDTVQWRGIWNAPRIDTPLPDTDDLSWYYYTHGISALCYVTDDSISVTGQSQSLYYTLRRQIPHIRDAVDDSGLSLQAAAFVTALLTGDSSGLGDDDRDRLSAAGISHIMALSGMHVALIILFVTLLLCPLDVAGKRHYRLLLTIVVIWIYAAATGLGASVVRASVMATMYMTARMCQMRHSGINGLCAAAIVILTCDPMQLFQPGFQLSFAAVASILLLARPLNPVDPRHVVSYKCAEAILVPVSAVIGTGVAGAYYFHRFAPLFVVSNIPVAILLPPLFIASLVCVICVQCGLDAHAAVSVVQTLYDTIDSIAAYSALSDGGLFDRIYISGTTAIVLYITLAALCTLVVTRRRIWAYVSCGMAVIFTLTILLTDRHTPQAGLHVIQRARYTDIMLHDRDRYYLVTTSAYPRVDDVAGSFARRHREYIGRHSLRFGGLLTDSFTDGLMSVCGSNISSADTQIRLIVADSVPAAMMQPHVGKAYVSRFFRGDIVGLSRVANADTIVILREINSRIAERYSRELTEAGVPHSLARPI